MSDSKTVRMLQEEVDTYISQFEVGYFSPLAMLARMTEELGELAREINHYYGEKPKKLTEKPKAIDEELGDMFFVLICMANSLNIDLEKSHEHVMHKFKTRDQNRWEKKQKEEGK